MMTTIALKDTQYIRKKKKEEKGKITNNGLQNITQKT